MSNPIKAFEDLIRGPSFTEMSEIPESLALEAKKIVDAMPARTPWKHEVEDAIALAILAENERCAKIAEEWKRKKLGRDISKATFDPCGRWEGGEIYEEGKEKNLIADAIRRR